MRKRPPKPIDQPSQPRFKRSKRAKVSTDDRMKVLQEFIDELDGGIPFLNNNIADSDVVMSATSGLDCLLQIALSTTFRTAVSSTDLKGIFKGRGPLATFDSKIRVCIALGIITSDFREDINIIRTIRNSFAHSIPVKGFSDEDIKSDCSKLKCRSVLQVPITSAITSMPKRNFVESCLRIYEFLIVSISFSVLALELVIKNKEAAHTDYDSCTCDITSSGTCARTVRIIRSAISSSDS